MQAVTVSRGIREGTLGKTAYCAACVYIALPVMLFMMGWFSWVAAVPLTLALFWFTYTACRDRIGRPAEAERAGVVSPVILGAMALLALVWVFLTGTGGFFRGAGEGGNVLFRLLTDEFWPAVRELSGGYETRFISYGIGSWIPAAAVGKKLGLTAGNIFLFLWAAAGLCIALALFCRKAEKWGLLPAAVFIVFNGLGILWGARNGNILAAAGFAVTGWLLTMLILDEEENRRVILFWSCGVLTSPYAFFGMLPFVVWRIIRNSKGSRKGNSLFSFENLLGCVICFVSFLYLFGSRDPQAVHIGPAQGDLLPWLLYILAAAGLFALVWPEEKGNPLAWTALGTAVLCALIRFDGADDFRTLAGIPALAVLCLLSVKSLRKARQEGKMTQFTALLCVLAVGAAAPLLGAARTDAVIPEAGETEGEAFFRSSATSAAAGDSLLADYFMEIEAPAWRYDEIIGDGGVIGEITGEHMVEQCFRMPSNATVSSVSILFATYQRTNECTLELVLKDEEGNAKTLAVIDCSTLADNALYTAEIEPVTLKRGKLYALEFATPDAVHGNAVTMYRSADAARDWAYAALDGVEQDYDLAIGFGK